MKDKRTTRVALALIAVGLAASLFLSSRAEAQTPCSISPGPCAWNEDCLTWNRPTTYSDGTALASTEIGTYQIEAAAIGSTTWTQVGQVTAPTQGYKRTGLKHGDAFQYRVWVTLKSGVKSATASNVCNLTTTEPTPTPPVLSVNDALAYEIYTPPGGVLTARAVGAVALDTECMAETQKVGTITYNRVATAEVDEDVRPAEPNWRKNPDLKRWARCG